MKQGGYTGANTLVAGAEGRHSRLTLPAMRQTGFTIVEVMIVLAITSALFVMAAAFISGRQDRTAFTTSINGVQQQMQQLINETASGFFPQSTSFSCTRGASAPPLLVTQAAGDHQGQNPGCIFLGKVIQFGVKDSSPQTYQVYPMVGNRMDTTNSVEASTLYGATGTFPEAAAAGTTLATNSALTGADSAVVLPYGLHAVSMWYGTNMANTTGTVGFISSLPSPNGSGVASGTQHLALYTVASTALQQTTPQVVDAMYPGILNTQPLTPVTSVNICIASGTTNQSGLITIGPNDTSASSSLAVALAIRGGLVC